MNERIKELVKLATTTNIVQCNGWEGKSYLREEEYFDKEKFAELIVRECAAIADIERSNNVGCGYITKTKGMLIKEYFGVEE